ncbi:hypothetical protein BDY19DRAFT_900611 [Irpex rosettiformis]|uniref:Uncharacterized protein n=2 Tax=Irpex rosettiformis TaxID=378272 RepID=A0ACB8TMH2_9APHY|nr:hypothetical protein BDY19DRAFT_900737 [Irpex rosettiformis]KAI0083215.1 hypothetical protein BDY19DRAFT_900611 [Irpex rosettiformis]
MIENKTKSHHDTATASITSWWPTSEIWASSGYFTGYWSHAAETWFQRRLQRIKTGEAVPLTSNEWRRTLRHTASDSQKFFSNIERLSASRV